VIVTPRINDCKNLLFKAGIIEPDNWKTLTLEEQWVKLRQDKPNIRIRDAAQELGVSEVELLATDCGDSVKRLKGNWGELIQELPKLGKVMALTRNAEAVHEKTGEYENVSIFGKMGLVLGQHIDLRLFLQHWHFGFAVETVSHGRKLQSFQFFDGDGTAVHKVYLTPKSNCSAYDKLVQRYLSKNQYPSQLVQPKEAAATPTRDEKVDVEFFRAEWDGLRDTHDFIKLLRKFNVTRQQALRLAEIKRAYQVSPACVRLLLEIVQKNETEIMIFVGSPGVIQIHTGPIRRFISVEPWLNVMDPAFNLHFREDLVAECWVVLKPTADGIVTSLETFNTEKQSTAMFFGKRKPGEPELEAWRKIIAQLPRQELETSTEKKSKSSVN
jgi:putative hemin transport protein